MRNPASDGIRHTYRLTDELLRVADKLERLLRTQSSAHQGVTNPQSTFEHKHVTYLRNWAHEVLILCWVVLPVYRRRLAAVGASRWRCASGVARGTCPQAPWSQSRATTSCTHSRYVRYT